MPDTSFAFRPSLVALAAVLMLSACVTDQGFPPYDASGNDRPSLILTQEPAPKVIFERGSHDTVLTAPDNAPPPVYASSLRTQSMETPVTLKAQALQRDLDRVRGVTESFGNRLRALQSNGEAQAAGYYAAVAAINADLQAGTTPGNPILVDRWNAARDRLNAISEDAGLLNTLAMDLSYHASNLAFLQESTKAAFSLSGAVDEDHRKLTAIEDSANREIVAVNRLMTKVNDDISRRASYLRNERANLQTLSLAVANGELFGKSLTNSVFKRAEAGDQALLNKMVAAPSGGASSAASDADAVQTRRPLVVIRFDHPGVRFEQPMYAAVSQALEKYPAAKFDIVAVGPAEGNPARLALAAADARKNGEAVLRALTDMGLPMERVHLSTANSRDVANSEVRIYIQ